MPDVIAAARSPKRCRKWLGPFLAIGAAVAAPAAAQTAVDARSFSPAPHAGTTKDPWPGSAIAKAILSLPDAGGTVSVADGIWLFDTQQLVSRGNFTLQGASLNAQLIFTTGFLAIGANGDNGPAISNVTISGLTADQSGADPNSADNGIQIWKCTGCELSDSLLYGHANVSVAVFITQGGADGRILRNKFTTRGGGGSQLQINPLYDDTNSGFVVDSNELDSVGFLSIGMNHLTVTNNNVNDKTLGNFIGMFFAAACKSTSHDILVQNNTVDASFGGNGAVISGVPQDPGCGGSITNFTIDNNTLRGDPIIGSSVYDDQSCLATCSDITQTTNFVVTNNVLDAQVNLGHFANINVQGGLSGSVHGATITGNTVNHDAVNVIQEDNHSFNVRIGSNAGCTGTQITRSRCKWLRVQHFHN